MVDGDVFQDGKQCKKLFEGFLSDDDAVCGSDCITHGYIPLFDFDLRVSG
jgi:hypothetical protein